MILKFAAIPVGEGGDFIEALNFRVRGGNKVLEDHLKTCDENRAYISMTS